MSLKLICWLVLYFQSCSLFLREVNGVLYWQDTARALAFKTRTFSAISNGYKLKDGDILDHTNEKSNREDHKQWTQQYSTVALSYWRDSVWLVNTLRNDMHNSFYRSIRLKIWKHSWAEYRDEARPISLWHYYQWVFKSLKPLSGKVCTKSKSIFCSTYPTLKPRVNGVKVGSMWTGCQHIAGDNYTHYRQYRNANHPTTLQCLWTNFAHRAEAVGIKPSTLCVQGKHVSHHDPWFIYELSRVDFSFFMIQCP